MPHALAAAAAQLEPALLGHGLLPVGPGGLREQLEDGLGLLGGERVEGLDRSGGEGVVGGVVGGHGYEGTARARRRRSGRAGADGVAGDGCARAWRRQHGAEARQPVFG